MQTLLWRQPRLELQAQVRDNDKLLIEMSEDESALICGIIKEQRPSRILEIGVSAGGTSALILKTMAMLNLPAKLFSVDVLPKWARDESKPSGFVVSERFPQLAHNWELYLGRVASVPLQSIGPNINLCIIDTMHITPGEILDFIVALPYLAPGAIVVLHDIGRHFDRPYNDNAARYATSLLFSAVVAEKLMLVDNSRQQGLANIAVFKVTADTVKYIANVFMALSISWAFMPPPQFIMDYLRSIETHYHQEFVDYFKRIVNMNMARFGSEFRLDIDESRSTLVDTFSRE